jgi:hypothetical protein
VREFVFIIIAIAVALAWMGIWGYCLHLFGFATFAVFRGQPEDRGSRRERIKKMGKLRYILTFGVLGFGLALGLGITTADLLARDSHGWVAVVGKLVLLSVLGGWFQGARIWNEAFRDPVPFPPNYPPPK